MAEAIIQIKALSKTYNGANVAAVDKLDLDVQQGEIFGLLGPNGAGKSTTIAMLCGLLPADAGIARINGLSINENLKKIKGIIGVVPQDIALYPTLTVYENLTYFGKLFGISGKQLRNTILDYCTRLGLQDFMHKKVATYSGGMKRRANLIAAIMHNPTVLFLDEPTVGIDVQSRGVIISMLKALNQGGMTIIYTSHHMEEAEHFCDRIAIIDQGKIIVEGVPSKLVDSKEEYINLESVFLHLTGRALRDA